MNDPFRFKNYNGRGLDSGFGQDFDQPINRTGSLTRFKRFMYPALGFSFPYCPAKEENDA